MCQPPKSPDLNILDLGFFSAIQSLQHRTCPNGIEDIVHAVEDSFDEFPTKKVNYIFFDPSNMHERDHESWREK